VTRADALGSQGCDLPTESSQLPTHCDSHHSTSLSTVTKETLPTFVESALSAPGNVNHPWVLAFLPLRDVMRRTRYMAILPGGFDEQPSSMLGAGFGDSTLAALLA
jgi:hypothetical protein